MKKKLYEAMVVAMMIGMVGCGKTKIEPEGGMTVEPTSETAVTEEVTPEPDAETTPEPSVEEPTASEEDTGVYPTATGIVELGMGITDELCTFKAPLNYVLAGGYYDENMDKQVMEGLNSATTTVEEALAAGRFDTDKNLALFTMTSIDEDATMITTRIYPSELMSWEELRSCYDDVKEMEGTEPLGMYYHTEAMSGECVTVAIKLNENALIQMVYEGSLEDEIGTEELAQRLYQLVTVK